jgi:protein O-GlcNAc transferase
LKLKIYLYLKIECSEAYCNKGVSLISLEKYEEAIECFEKAIQIRPNYPLALQNYGSALVELKK